MVIDSSSSSESNQKVYEDKTIYYGKIIAHPPPEESVVITGMSGKFPNTNNVKEYAENLLNKVDMVTPTTRWPEMPNVPKRSGQLPDLTRLDNSFFGIPYWIAYGSDPMVRLFLERAIEAIFDAGINIKDLEGTNTGVFVGSCYSESEALLHERNSWTGVTRSMIANRVSYFLKLKGPSFICDSACSSSLTAVEVAYRAIRGGECDAAIVGGVSVCLHPNVSYQFYSLGVLSMDGACKPFDDSSNGYARSDAVCAIFMQKSKDAKRIYAKVLHAKLNCDGYKEKGITFPSGETQAKLLKECYEEADISADEITFIEAHGTGTVVGDPEEAMALDENFCKKRKSPLLVGSCKSSVGHSEPASGLCSVIKCLIAFETGYIPPNLHFSKARTGVKALKDGRLKVVTEKTPLPKGKCIIGINNFGFGGANTHVILQNFEKEKVNYGIPEDNLPRIVCVSGRVPDAITTLLDQVSEAKHGFDVEFVRLLHNLFGNDIQGHIQRGFSIISKSGELYRSMKIYSGNPTLLCMLFGGFDNDWNSIAEELLELPLFATSIKKIHDILIRKGININEIIMQRRQKSLLEQILGNIVVQLAFVDILKAINLEANLIFGNGINEFISAYYDEVLSLNDVIECICIIGNLCEKQQTLSLYLVEVDAITVGKVSPTSTFVESLNETLSLVYCPTNNSSNFVNIIKSNGILIKYLGQQFDYKSFVKKDQLIKQFEKIVTQPKQWSSKHLLHPYKLANAEYFVLHLLNPTNYNDFANKINQKSIILEIGSTQFDSLFKKIILKNKQYFHVTTSENSLVDLLKVLGKLYEEGFCTRLDKLYPEVKFPVSRKTQSLASSIKWYHEKEWFVPHNTQSNTSKLGERIFNFRIQHSSSTYLTGHNIDGRNLFPASGYFRLVWEVLGLLEDQFGCKNTEEMKIVFQNCRFMRATTLPKETTLSFTVMIQTGTGNFEISENNVPVVKGNVQNILNDNSKPINLQQVRTDDNKIKMTTKDIYKELRLRGYNYSGGFKAIQECNISATEGLIKWDNNWITFIDNMFQMKILQCDTRFLYVPTSITKLTIDAKRHNKIVKSLGEDSCIPVQCFPEADILRSGGVEVIGLKANSISRRKDLSDPVLEQNQFVPNISDNLSLDEAVRVNIQLLLENVYSSKLKVVEIIDEFSDLKLNVLAPIVNKSFGDQPIVKAETIILSSSSTKYQDCDNIPIENKSLASYSDCNLIIGTQFLSRPIFLQEAFRVLKENCYIISREPKDVDLRNANKRSVNILTFFSLENECLVLISKPTTLTNHEVIDISKDPDFSWIETVKNAAKRNCNIIVLSENDDTNGILGLVNCLRRELNPDKIKCVFLMDRAPPFDLDNNFYYEQIEKNLAVNVYKNGKWGTYRHLLIDINTFVNCAHSYVNVNSPGDLSSLKWVQGPLNYTNKPTLGRTLVNVYYSAINFRDIMTAAGKITADVITMDRLLQGCVQGFEFSGKIVENGRRIFGTIPAGALSTMVEADNIFLWNVPSDWSMAEAATVPVCYCTVILALIQTVKIKKGNTILIHAGSGGVGQAAINIALYYGCTVFTTVGTTEKREYLKKHFPQLKDSNIGCSRDLSFVTHIMNETNGEGVDIVLNSLAEEKLFASVSCVKQNGHFIEIGKFDMANNNILRLMLLKKNASFHGLMLDHLFWADPHSKYQLYHMVNYLIDVKAIKPLNVNLFKSDEVEKAFRFMGAGKHIGKVLLELCKEESPKSEKIKFSHTVQATARYYCHPEKTTIIVGGLGGFGLELADWLILRGAKKIVLTSRTGIRNGYQAYRIKAWESYGVIVQINTADVTTEEGCKQLLETAQVLGPVEAIFNLAVVLKDALLENQNAENFKISLGPKALATTYLDTLTRQSCPDLRLFVVFSSVSCGRGNAGQTNYGMANSIMERICEKRKQEGYPGLAIQWGAVGDVGLVADMQEEHKELEIGGTLQQRIFNCLKVLDGFLMQKDAAIVSSMVVAEKRIGGSDNIIDVIADILGIKDLKTVSLHTTFPEMGMDSMTAVEIKQTLERDYEIFLTSQDIREMTFARLLEFQESRLASDNAETKTDLLGGVDLMLRLLGDEKLNNIPLLELKSCISNDENAEPVLFFPGVEGVATVLDPLVQNLHVKAYGVQFGCVYEKDSIRELAEAMLPYIKPMLKSKDFKFVGHSFGVIFALEVVALLETLGYKGKLICIDGSPEYLKELTNIIETDSEDKLQTTIILKIMSLRMKLEDVAKYRDPLMNCKSLEERVALVEKVADEKLEDENKIANAHFRQMVISSYKRIKSVVNYSPSFSVINSEVVLFKCEFSSLHGLSSDYGLSKVCGQNVKTIEVKANHITVLKHPMVAQYINDNFTDNVEKIKENIDEKVHKVENDFLKSNLQSEEIVKQRS